MAMVPVFMDNDIGGVVHVGKNTIVVHFSNGRDYKFWINTNNLLRHLESRSKEELEGRKYYIEPMYRDPEGALLVIISLKDAIKEEIKKDIWDKATIFRFELIEALKKIEHRN